MLPNEKNRETSPLQGKKTTEHRPDVCNVAHAGEVCYSIRWETERPENIFPGLEMTPLSACQQKLPIRILSAFRFSAVRLFDIVIEQLVLLRSQQCSDGKSERIAFRVKCLPISTLNLTKALPESLEDRIDFHSLHGVQVQPLGELLLHCYTRRPVPCTLSGEVGLPDVPTSNSSQQEAYDYKSKRLGFQSHGTHLILKAQRSSHHLLKAHADFR